MEFSPELGFVARGCAVGILREPTTTTMTTIPNPFPASKKNSDIRFGTYNIQSGRNGRLETCLRAMGQMGLDWGILTETKLTGGIHTRFSSDYHVFATDAASASQGGVALFYRESSLFSIESVRRHGPNCLSFQLVTLPVLLLY